MIVHVGKAPLTLVRRLTGRTDYVYQGQPAPSDAVEGEFERLVAEGYLLEVEIPDQAELEVVETTVPGAPPSLADMTVDQLQAYAAERQIDVGRASSVDGLIAKITEAGQA